MKDQNKTRAQLLSELAELRQRVTELETAEAERKQAVEALRESEGKYRSVIENIQDVFYRSDLGGRLLMGSPSGARMFGYDSVDEMIGMPLDSFWPDPKERQQLLAQIKATGSVRDFEAVLRRKDGATFSASFTTHFYHDDHGNLLGTEGIIRDVTEHKLAEEALRIKENAIASAINGMAIGEFGGSLTFVNRSFLRLWGYEDESQVLGKPAVDFWQSEEQAARIIDALSKSDSWVGELAAKRKDGSSFDVQIAANVVRDQAGKPICMMSSFLDITERKLAEEALRASEARYRRLFETAREAILVSGPDGQVISANPAAAVMLGRHSPQEMIGKSSENAYTDPAERQRIFSELESKGYAEGFEVALIKQDGSGEQIHVSGSATLHRGSDGQMERVETILTDITERKRAEQALKESEEKFRSLAEQSPNMVFINQRGKVLYANTRCEEIMGHTREEFYSADFDFRAITAPEYIDLVDTKYAQHMRGEEVEPYEYALIAKDGKRIEVISATRLIDFGGESAVLGIITDITVRKRAEAQLERNLRETRLHFEISQALAGAETEDEVLDVLIQRAGLYPQAHVAILTFDRTGSELAVILRRQDAFESSLIVTVPTGTRFPASSFTLLNLYRSDQPFVSNDILADERIDPATRELFRPGGVASHAAFPLTAGNEWSGFIGITAKPAGYFDEEKQHLYQTLAEQGAVALRAAHLRETIRESQRRLSLLVQQSPLAVIEWTTEFQVVSWNPAAEQIFGYAREEALGRHAAGLIEPEEARPRLDQIWQAVLAQKGGTHHTRDHLTKDGRRITCEVFYSPLVGADGQVIGVVSLVEDITERKRAEEALRAGEQRFRQLVESVTDYIYTVKIEAGHPVATSHGPGCVTVTGYTPEEYAADPQLWYRMVYEEDRPAVTGQAAQVLSGETASSLEHRIVHKDGSIRWVKNTPVPRHDDQGCLVAYDGLIADITDRKRAEEALQESENRFKMVSELTSDYIFRFDVDADGHVVMNLITENLYATPGRTLEEVRTPDLWANIIHPDDLGKAMQLLQTVIIGRRSGEIDCRTYAQGGQLRWAHIFVRPVLDPEKQRVIALVGAAKDITERKQAEEALQRDAREMAALYETSLEINAQPDIPTLLQTIVERATGLLNVPMGRLYLMKPDGETLELVVSHNLPKEYVGVTLHRGEGVAGRVAQTGQPLMVEDYFAWEEKAAAFVEPRFHHVLGVPLKVGNRILGVIMIDDDKPGVFSQDEVRLVSLFADQAAVALENARLYQAERDQREFAETLREVSAVLVSTLDAGAVLDRILDQIGRVVPHDAATLMLIESGVARIEKCRGYAERGLEDMILGLHFQVAEVSNLRTMMDTGQPIVIPDVKAYPGWVKVPETGWIRSHLGAPLRIKGQVVGFLSLNSTAAGFFTEAHAERLQAFADQAAMALENARLFEEARRRLDEMGVVSNVALVGAAGRPFDEAVTHATQALSRLWPDATLGFLFLDEADGSLRPHSSYYGVTPEALASLHLSLGQGLTGRVMRERQPIRVGDVTADPHYISYLPGIRSEMAAPLVAGERVLGVVNVESPRSDAFSGDDLRLLTTLAGQLAIVFEKARLDAALTEHTTLLEQRVQERTAELSAANVELARASRMKDEFLAAMTHELRTPLNAVLGMSGALLEAAYGPLNEKQLKSVQTIEESGWRLLELINNILDLSRLMAGKVELQMEPVRVEEICQMSLQSIQRAAQDKKLGVSLQVDDAEATVQADGRRLRQVLVYLLSNAVKFTPEGGAIGLEVVKDAEKSVVHLTVWDTGIGITPEDIGRLFQPFVQLDSKLSRRYGGTGLGLTLVEWLVRLHGGHVTVESEVGHGSRFTVSLPTGTSSS